MKGLRRVAITLPGFLAAGGIVGSLAMIADPHGTPWRMQQSLLRYSPFSSFLAPGILLLATNGLLPAWVLFLAAWKRRHYGWWTVFQGVVLLTWLAVEGAMLRMVLWPHYLYGAVALGLTASGLALRRDEAGTEAARDRGIRARTAQ